MKKLKMKTFKKILLLSLSICILLSGCSFESSLKENTAISVINNRISDESNDKYYHSILTDLKVTNDSNDVYSKELIKYLLNKASFSVDKIKGNTVTLNIKAKNIYSYLNGNTFLTEYIIKSNSFLETNITAKEYNTKLIEFLKEKINSNEVPFKTFKYEIEFIYDEENMIWSISDKSYEELVDVILCRNSETEKQILSKLEPLEFNLIEFIPEEIVVVNPDIDDPLDYKYDKTNEKTYKYNQYLIPEDLEYKDIPSENKTTRTSRRSAIYIGETAVFDGAKLEQAKFDYKANIMIENVLSNKTAVEFLEKNNEEIDKSLSYIVFKINIKLISNNTNNEKISFSFTDFDLINFDNETYSYVTLKNLESFKPISKGQQTSGYIAFSYDGSELINLAFREFLPNTIWFEFN